MSSRVRLVFSEPGARVYGSQAIRRVVDYHRLLAPQLAWPQGLPMWRACAQVVQELKALRRMEDVHFQVFRDCRGAKRTAYIELREKDRRIAEERQRELEAVVEAQPPLQPEGPQAFGNAERVWAAPPENFAFRPARRRV